MIFINRIEGMRVLGDKIAPIKHLSLAEPSDDRSLDNHTIERITQEVSHPTMQSVDVKTDNASC